jgi:hypothetical protein
MIGREFILARMHRKIVPLIGDAFPIARFHGVEEFLNLGRNLLLRTPADCVNELAPLAAKLGDFTGNDFFRSKLRRGAMLLGRVPTWRIASRNGRRLARPRLVQFCDPLRNGLMALARD